MFFNTPPTLLKPIHSLFKDPFYFSARKSIDVNLRSHLDQREDFESILALGSLYENLRAQVLETLVNLRPRLENELSPAITAGTNLNEVCETSFSGASPNILGMDGGEYLRNVTIQCQLERLYDALKIRQSGAGNPLKVQQVHDAIRFLILNEVLGLCLAGIARVEHTSKQFRVFVANSTAQESLRATWFARIADQGSQAGTLALAKNLAQNGASTVKDIAPLIIRILDQDLSIPWGRLTQQGLALKSIQAIHTMVSLTAVLIVKGFRNEELKLQGPDLVRVGFNFEAVSNVIRRQQDALVTDQFIGLYNGTLKVNIEGVSKGLRQYFRTLELEFEERDALRLHAGGLFFEKTHIRQRIEYGNDYSPRYRIHDGFDRYKVLDGVPNECDVEFIIQDTEQKHFYFIQVKHALLGEKAFFSSVIEAIQNDFAKGLRQLREAKRLLEQCMLAKTLNARGIPDATLGNSSFVLLHNIAQLDFQSTVDGISLYDWSSFRNLLKDAECSFGHSNGQQKLVCLPTPAIVDHPQRIISRLLNEHIAYREVYVDPWATERATTKFFVLGTEILVHGLGI